MRATVMALKLRGWGNVKEEESCPNSIVNS